MFRMLQAFGSDVDHRLTAIVDAIRKQNHHKNAIVYALSDGFRFFFLRTDKFLLDM